MIRACRSRSPGCRWTQAQQLLARARPAPLRAERLPRPPARCVARPRWAGSASPSPSRPASGRDDVVLPEVVLTRVERHALGVAGHREALLAAGQHLKRGLLLYGPPGTGKTHTTRYLLGQMSGYTRLVLTGRTLVAVGAVTDLARALLPAVVVLEDVDLVAEERSHRPGVEPGPVRPARRDGRRGAGRRPAVPAHHQPRRPARARAGRAAGPGGRRGGDRPAGRPRPQAPARRSTAGACRWR